MWPSSSASKVVMSASSSGAGSLRPMIEPSPVANSLERENMVSVWIEREREREREIEIERDRERER